MFIYTTYQTPKQTLRKLKRLNLFSQISILNNNRLRLTTRKPVYLTEDKEIKKIQEKLREIKTISPYAFYPFTKKIIKKVTKKEKPKRLDDENYKRRLHIFFDIDSTLTHKHVSTINSTVRSLFEQFKQHNCNLYFCSGRAYQEIKRLTKSYHFGHEYGIAESGGIILGMGDADGGLELADNTEPKKLLGYLLEKKAKKKLDFNEDPNQRSRRTEIVLDLNSISEKTLKNAIHNSHAKVECHKSKQAYHITTKGVNKGTAIEKLKSEELKVDSRMEKVIGVGDSDLDLQMFEYCDESYIVGDADKAVKRKIPKKYWLKKIAPWSIDELYKRLFPFG